MKPLILIVDDTPKNIQVLGNILHDKGYNLCVATSGFQALESIKIDVPDLILLDIQMPEMDGFEVCKRLKSNANTKEIPIIFLTAVIEPEKIVHGFDLGAVDYIIKPFNIVELTARVAAHIEIKQSREQLQELNATKDKFFKIIAHDLRNPFGGIMGLSQIMEKNLLEGSDTSKHLKYTQLIYETSKSAFELLENLMLWAMSQQNSMSVDLQNISIKELLSTVILIISANAFKKNITVENRLSEHDIVYADASFLSTIFRNLLTNAIKFTNAGGQIIVSANRRDGFFEISVTDSGVGMEQKNLERIFRIDSKFSCPGTENEKGTGLGLILCKEFVEKQGGKIWVTSQIGVGTTFLFTLPTG
jgi:two-component system, sensor histidine kinase and response regulator